MQKEFDILVYGATGFTGRLVTQYLKAQTADSNVTWAVAGRSESKLKALMAEFSLPEGVSYQIADSSDPAALREAIGKARVVLTTVGPYARYGNDVVAACAELGVHYCDLTGEVHWMRRMIDAHQKTAEASGAIIVHTCGFDSIPSDLGTYYAQKVMRERHGVPARHVKYRAREFKGGFSGGTLDSMWSMMEEMAKDPSIGLTLADPYALNPKGQRRGMDGPDRMTPEYDPDFGAWIAPFVMAQINTRVVRRSNALLGGLYGADFRYDEGTLIKDGPLGFLGAAATSLGMSGMNALSSPEATRKLLQRVLPKPGEGPDEETIKNGFYVIDLLAKHPTDKSKDLTVRVTGDQDPGYGSTSKMLAESAAALAAGEAVVGGGFWTPASAIGDALLQRLPDHAGITFEVL